MNSRSQPTKKAEAPFDFERFPPPNATRASELRMARAEREQRERLLRDKAAAAPAEGAGKRAQAALDASNGKLPPAPDFSAPTHERFRPKLAELVKLVKAKDVKALKAFDIKPISTSPKALDRYRNLAVIALEAQAAKKAAAK